MELVEPLAEAKWLHFCCADDYCESLPAAQSPLALSAFAALILTIELPCLSAKSVRFPRIHNILSLGSSTAPGAKKRSKPKGLSPSDALPAISWAKRLPPSGPPIIPWPL